jgi:hypothetical protein
MGADAMHSVADPVSFCVCLPTGCHVLPDHVQHDVLATATASDAVAARCGI